MESVACNSWQEAEQALRTSIDSVVAYTERLFHTAYGDRIVDAYNAASKVIAEAKYGYQSLSSFILSEIQRDSFLLHNGDVDFVEWHFYYSEISKTIGGSYNLIHKLIEEGIDVIFH